MDSINQIEIDAWLIEIASVELLIQAQQLLEKMEEKKNGK